MKHTAAASLSLFLLASSSLGSCTSSPPPSGQEEMTAARREAKWRRRRIIMNNDGNDLYGKKLEAGVTPEVFLAARTTPLLGSQVDSIFYCTGVFNLYTHRSEETELLKSAKAAARNVYRLIDRGTDSLEVMTRFCHEHGLEAFWSMRMNDTHDSSAKNSHLFCDWKKKHPQFLVGTRKQKFRYGGRRWSSVDYNHAEVRDKVFRIFEDVCGRYAIDGIELDFFRHPVIFKEQMIGKPITQEQCELFTELVRRIRRMTEAVALRRGRPLLIAVRIPDSVGYCKALGLDLEAWLEEDLIDIVTGGGYFKLEPWENLAALGRKHDVPVYACFVRRRIEKDGTEPEGDTAMKVWRGEAYRAWQAGAHGIYTFNRFKPSDRIFWELGDPKLLETRDRTDQTVFVNEKCWSKPELWLKGGRRFARPGL